jgi:hypothetical protein
MKNCPQTNTQSVYEHCLSVKDHLHDLLSLMNGVEPRYIWKLPEWILQDKILIVSKLLPVDVLLQYAEWHDCGKPFCRVVDEQGKQHFPNHAEVSERVWRAAGGDEQTGKLIRLDMEIHTIKAVQVPEFAARAEAISLLLTGLAEVHSNARMFGGVDSTSFKIKYNQIEKRGRAILALLRQIHDK